MAFGGHILLSGGGIEDSFDRVSLVNERLRRKYSAASTHTVGFALTLLRWRDCGVGGSIDPRLGVFAVPLAMPLCLAH